MFQKGVSGNPAGPAKGTRHTITMLAEKLMQDDVGNVVAAVVDAAVKGDMAAAKIILDRIAPARRGRPVSFDLPRIETPADIANALGAVAGAMAEGELTPDEANAVAGVIEFRRRAIETVEHEERLRKLEERNPGESAY
jgi:Family of unknown function (DUF5681)